MMKKIYNLLCWGALLLLASCEEEGTEVIELGTKDPVVSITGISPDYGYVGDEFDVIGENLAGAVDFVKVSIGENVAKVLACTDERITVQIPEDATTGKISVDFFDEKLKTDLMLRVLGQPSVETISRDWGFVGDLITFTGTELGTKAEDIKMIFGDAKVNAPVTEWSETSFTVQVPIGATSGKISLMVYTKQVNTPVDKFTIRQHAGLTELSPATAYKGAEVTIKGKNFGTTTEGVKVLLGGVEAEVLSCSEEEIKIRIPVSESLEDGKEVAVKVTTPYEEVDGELNLVIKATPVVDADAGISSLEGYVGTVVTVKAANMPETAEQLIVKFGDVQAIVSDYQYKDENSDATFTVKVPNGVSAGNVQLTMAIGKLQFYDGTFKINSSPVMNDIAETVVLEGESVTIKGTDFGTDKEAVQAYLNETEVEITSIKDDEIKVAVPADFGTTKNVKVSLRYADIPTLEGYTVNVMGKNGGDVTAVVLENCQRPFMSREGSQNGVWAIPSGWQLNRDFYAMIYDARDVDGRISFLSSTYDKVNTDVLKNDKMYQVVTLPAGRYKFTLTIPECNYGNAAAFEVLFGVTRGVATLPDLQGSREDWKPVKETDFIDNNGQKSYILISDTKVKYEPGKSQAVELEVELLENETVTIGFVAYVEKAAVKNGANADVSNITVERQ